MATQVQNRRGTTAEHSTFTGAAGEITVDTDKEVAVVHDGSTAGGYPLMRENGSNSALALGSAGTPSLKFTGDTNTGIYSPGADQVAISTNGTGRLFVDASGTVSITPSNALPLAISRSSDGELFRARRVGGTYNPGLLISASDTTNNEIVFNTAYSLGSAPQYVWQSGSNERMRLDSSGRLGLGTSSPSTLLTVQGDGTFRVSIGNVGVGLQTGSLSGSWYLNDADDSLRWYSSTGGDRLTISSAGNVGIGTTSPGYLVTAATSADGVDGVSVESPSVNGVIRLRADGTNGNAIRVGGVGAQGNTLRFLVGGDAERARIDSSGRLLVGTSTARSTGALGSGNQQIESASFSALQLFANANDTVGSYLGLWKSRGGSVGGTTVVSNGDTLGQLIFGGYDGASAIPGGYITCQVDGTPGTNDMPGRIVLSTTSDGAASPTERMRITSAGNVGIGTTSPTVPLFVNGEIYAKASSGGDNDYGVSICSGPSLANTSAHKIRAGGGTGQLLIIETQTAGGNGQILLATNGSERARIDSSGRLGLGTSSPGYKLDVNGEVAFSPNTAGKNTFYFTTNASNDASLFLKSNTTDKVNIQANGSSYFNGGNVGIGTTTVDARLLVSDGTNINTRIGQLTLDNFTGEGAGIRFSRTTSDDALCGLGAVNAGDGDLGFFSRNNLIFATGGASSYSATTERARIDSSGRLGLGTSAPQAELNVAKVGGTSTVYIESDAGNNATTSILRFGGASGRSASIQGFRGASSNIHSLDFYTYNSADAFGMRLTPTGLGIGTTSPSSTLHVEGTGRFVAANSAIFNGTAGTYTTWLNNGAAVGDIGTGNQAISGGAATDFAITARNTNLVLGTNTTERLRIDSSGRVGIGTTSPSSLLTLRSTAANNTAGISMQGASAGNITNLYNTFTDLVVEHAAGEAFRVDGSRRVLVGTSSARSNFYNSTVNSQVLLESNGVSSGERILANVHTSATTSGPILLFGKGRSASVGGNTIVSFDDSLGELTFQGNDGSEFVEAASIKAFVDGTPGTNDMPGRIVLSTTSDGASSPTERMRIDSTGTVLIGMTSDNYLAADSGIQLTANGTARFGSDGTSARNVISFVNNTNGTPAEVGAIQTSGSSTSYATSSDYRLKENVVPLTNAVSRVNQLQVHRFNFITDPDKTVDGFIAHEAQAVVPECVTGTKDEVDDEGNPVYQGIDQSKLVPLLTAALQEAIAKIETLEARLTAAGIE
jgi:hypothetical protein